MAGKYQKNRIQHKGSLRVCLLLVLILLASGGIGTTVAKYIHSTDGKMLVKAPEFYFTSDLLTEDGKASYMLNSNVTEVEFKLSNAADDLRFSESDVVYEVSTTGGKLQCVSSGTTTAEIAKKLPNGRVSEVTWRLSGLEPGILYTVTAKGAAGYSQTLSATFQVADKDQNVYKNLTKSPDGYLLLTVWTHNVEGDLTISIPAGLIPDNTNPEMSEVYNVDDPTKNSFMSSFEKYTSKTYRFFGTTTGEIKVTGTVGESTYIVNESALP